jgi:hypothetical protein
MRLDQPTRPYFTDHALNRMVQLEISQAAVAAVLQYGRSYRKDAESFVFTVDNLVLRQRKEMAASLRKLKDLVVICKQSRSIMILTVYWRDRSRRCA